MFLSSARALAGGRGDSSQFPSVLLVPLVLILGSCTGVDTQHVIERNVDPNGYRYYTVSNDPTGVRVYTLDNGLTIYLGRNLDEPRIRSMMAVRSGAAFDPASHTGLAHYLEHLLFKGTDRIGALDWSREAPLLARIEELYERHAAETDLPAKKATYERIDALSVEAARYAAPGEYRKLASSIGAVAINGYTEYDLTGYWSLFPSTSLEKHLRLESERFRRPTFRAFQAELEIVYEEYNSLQDSPARQKQTALDAILFPTHPYGQQTLIGTAEHLKNPSIRAIRSHFDTHYVPGNMALVLVGDLQFDETIQLVDKYFGRYEAKPVERPVLPREEPLETQHTTTITGPGEDSILLGFRMGGADTRDPVLMVLADLVLNNGTGGLIDVELNAKQTVGRVRSHVDTRNDYSIHYFDGYPRSGQSLEEVRDRILEQIQRMKDGDFDDWLIRGVVNDLKKHRIQNHATSVNLSAACMHSFKTGETWRDHVAFVERVSQISKQELVDFVSENYRNPGLVFYRQGDPGDVVRVTKPDLSPRDLNEAKESSFAAELTKGALPLGEPRFVDYGQRVTRSRTQSGVEVEFVENEKNSLFDLVLIFDMGTDRDPLLGLAAGYCGSLGTDNYTVDELRRSFYESGLTFSCFANADQTMFHLAGLQENLETGVELLEHFLSRVQPDDAAYLRYVDQVLKQRQAKLSSPGAILDEGLLSYALYGENSSLRNVLDEQQLRDIRPETLTNLIRTIRRFEHRVFFFGRNHEQVLNLLDRHYRAEPVRKVEREIRYLKQPTRPAVYFVDFDAVQAHVMIVTRGERFDPLTIGPSNFYSPYIDHVLYREIRNTRSLAYSTTAAHLMARHPSDFDYSYFYAGTQADKLTEALAELLRIVEKLPGTDAEVAYIREDQLKRYASERVDGADIFWRFEGIRRWGLERDVRRDQYVAAQKMTLATLIEFSKKNVGQRDVAILVVGDREKLDMNALGAHGKVIELEAEYLFNF